MMFFVLFDQLMEGYQCGLWWAYVLFGFLWTSQHFIYRQIHKHDIYMQIESHLFIGKHKAKMDIFFLNTLEVFKSEIKIQ